MATVWYPRSDTDRRWLCEDGSIINEPDQEDSGSGRRTRIVGSDKSTYQAERDEAVWAWVDERAKARSTRPWVALGRNGDTKPFVEGVLGVRRDAADADLWTLRDAKVSHVVKATHIWWTFKHATLPIEAMVAVVGHTQWSNHKVLTALSAPDTTPPRTSKVHAMVPRYAKIDTPTWGPFVSNFDASSAAPPVADWLQGQTLGSTIFSSEFAAVKHFAKQVDWIDSLEYIEIPDMRTFNTRTGQVDWIRLERGETNCNAQLVSDVGEYLSLGPTVEKAAALYNELQEVLKRLGVELGPLKANELQQALLADQEKHLTVSVGTKLQGEDDEGAHKGSHTLSFHIPTGTFVVGCSVKAIGDAAHAYEESKALASITGQADELLAYAQAFARTGNEQRAKRIVKKRKAGK